MRSYNKYDTTGKSKPPGGRVPTIVVIGTFVVGLCIGLLIAERSVVSSRGAQLIGRLSDATHRIMSVGAHVDAILPYTGAPRSKLEALLRVIAPDHELLLTVANKNGLWDGMLTTYTDGITRVGLKNHLILALDQETVDFCTKANINVHRFNETILTAEKGSHNHAVSAQKFGIMRHFLLLGYSVLMSDWDIVILQNPFAHLHRDSDVEGMTDGFDDRTAYGTIVGFDDPSMGWARSAQAYHHFNLNSGLFFMRANARTLDLVTRLQERLSKEKAWDQQAYNEAMFHLSHDDYKSPQVTIRVMSYYKFMNSKVLFKDVRHRPAAQRAALPQPVMIHINYHPDKLNRMKGVIKYYVDGDDKALDKYPGGSEAGSRRLLVATAGDAFQYEGGPAL